MYIYKFSNCMIKVSENETFDLITNSKPDILNFYLQ
jgi:hypothetical protein